MITKEELKIAEEKYNLKMADNKAMRALLDTEALEQPFKFGPDIHIYIRTLGDILFHGVLQRQPTFYEDGSYQTTSGKRRTIEDIYKLQRIYSIKCRFKDVKEAFKVLQDNGFIDFVFCKRTLVNTYSKELLTATIEEINQCLNENNINFEIKKPIVKTLRIGKRKISSR